jgi:hypothetical protein
VVLDERDLVNSRRFAGKAELVELLGAAPEVVAFGGESAAMLTSAMLIPRS